MKTIATNIAITSDLLETERDKISNLSQETQVFKRKATNMESQIKQEISDKELILK
jgi:hypothetical protein